ncbi:MAG TPA: hypothetical protein VE178_13150 [Silvibacterium sp.]|nr:hypothetical protein [Silvibacterium sp.]
MAPSSTRSVLRPVLRLVLVALLTMFAVTLSARAVTCVTESQMTAAERDHLAQIARTMGADVKAGNVSAVRQNTIASVAAQFDGVAASIQGVAPRIEAATLTINAMYLLRATDLKATQDITQFFCSVAGSSLIVSLSIPQLPPGDYALLILRATGVEHPEQLTMLLQNDPAGSADWKLAGFFSHPITAAGHDGVWYWKAARGYAQKNEDWNAYFYYQTAAFLLNPVDFLSSPNLEKLQKEAQAVRPPNLPGANPMVLKAGSQNFEITSMRTDSSLGGLDLVINYQTKDVSDPVATHAQIVELMKAMLAQYPQLRQAFHGLWVYAHAPNQSPYAIELPMDQIS